MTLFTLLCLAWSRPISHLVPITGNLHMFVIFSVMILMTNRMKT